jgi:hypothetical protein
MTETNCSVQRRSMIWRLQASAALGALICSSGCSALDNCPDGRDPISITHGVSDKDKLYYDSAPWGHDLDHFPAKTALWFRHDLGVIPLLIQPFLSFSPSGTANEDGGSVALTAGNQTLVDCVDERVIVLRNDTCEPSFYIRLAVLGESQIEKDAEIDCCAKTPQIEACND